MTVVPECLPLSALQRALAAVLVLSLFSSAGLASGRSAERRDEIPAQLLREFFEAREVLLVALVTCHAAESLQLARALQTGTIMSTNTADLASARGRAGVYINLSCETGRQAMATLAARGVLSGAVACLTWSSTSEPFALNQTVEVDVTLARQDGNAVELVDVSQGESSPAGRWSPDGGLEAEADVEVANRKRKKRAMRGDLRGSTLRVAVVLHQMAVDGGQDRLRAALVDHTNTHLDTETRFGFALASHLAEMYNFTMQMVVTPSWGYSQPNGSFDGMVGMLQRGEIHLGITPAVITTARLAVVDFTVQTWTLRTCFIFRHPRLLVPYKALAEPFASSTWLGVAVLSAAATLVLWAVRRAERAERAGGAGGDLLVETLVAVIGLVSQQGCAVDSGLMSGRAVLLCGLLLAVMIQSFYTSAIVTSLLTPIPRTIRTAHDLARSPLSLGLEDYSYNRAVFPNSQDPLTSSLYRDKILPAWPAGGGFFSVAEGVARVRRGGFAFYSEDSSLYKPIQDTFSEDEKCSLAEVELNPAFVTAAPVAKGSPLRELLNRGLLLMLERGLRARQRLRWSAQRPSCAGEASAVAAVGLDPIFPAHGLLLAGHLLAVVIVLLERRNTAPPATL